jgi:hypothetical protein
METPTTKSYLGDDEATARRLRRLVSVCLLSGLYDPGAPGASVHPDARSVQEATAVSRKAMTLEQATRYLMGEEEHDWTPELREDRIARVVKLTEDADHPLPCFRHGDQMFFSQAAIDAWIMYWETPEREGGGMTRLEELQRSVEGNELMNRMLEGVANDRRLCVTCRQRARLDGHLTCGRIECDESGARARAAEDWRRGQQE